MKNKIVYPKLPKVFKRKWVAALRSGKFKQGFDKLYDAQSETYCCLGVACIIAGAEKDTIKNKHFISGKLSTIPVPNELKKTWVKNPLVDKLSEMNDSGMVYNFEKKYGFKAIANWIEKNL